MSTVTALAEDSGTWLTSVRSALALPHKLNERLHFNGRELKWLGKRQPGWHPIAVPVKLLIEAEEETVCAA